MKNELIATTKPSAQPQTDVQMNPDTDNTIVLERTNKMDVEIDATYIASVSDWEHRGEKNNRYTRWTVYKTQDVDPIYVMHIEYTTQWQGEASHKSIKVFKTLKEIKHHFIQDDFEIDETMKELFKELGISTTVGLEEIIPTAAG